MESKIKEYINLLSPSFDNLMKMTPVKITFLPVDIPKSGIYLFSEDRHHLYVGRSNNLRTRIQQHSRPSSKHNSAPFAFRLARETTGKLHATYTSDGSRKHLEDNPEFNEVFLKEKERIRKMDIRYVKEDNPLRQALLEIFTAICLETPFNDFDTH